MITETAYLDSTPTTKSANMVATDHSADFTNCENKSQTLNVVTNGAYSFRSATKQLNETENELDNINNEAEDAADYGRPKKLQKGLANQGNNSNLINQQPSFGQLESSETSFKGKLFGDSEQQSNNQQQSATSGGGRRKANLADSEYEENFECLASKDHPSSVDNNNSSPKVPPLRIVISSSTTGRSSKDHLNMANSNYVVSTAAVDHSSSSSQTANDKKEESGFYSTRSSAGFQPQSTSSSTSSTNATTGRITRSQRAAAAQNHLTNDSDSQSRYSPDEFTHNEASTEATDDQQQPQQQQPANKIYMNSQTIKEKESNKENKDLRRRKGRGKSALQGSATASAGSLTSSVTTATSGSTSSNGTNGNASPSSAQVSYPPQSVTEQGAPMESDQTLDQSMISLSGVNLSSRDYQMPSYNCYNMFQNIRRQVDKRRQTMCDSIQPTKSNAQKPPSGFKNYLLSTGNYLLAGSLESRPESMRNVNPNLTLDQIDVPEMLSGLANTEPLIELYREQELERENLKVQHLVEREKVKLSIEQEILRVHNRAALAMANQSLPLSFTVLMKDEEIYNPIDQEPEHSFDRGNLEAAANQKESTKNEYSRATYSCQSNNTYADLFTLTGKSEDIGSRCRYSGRLLHSWLQDVEDKWSKIKKEILNRQRREAESLQAIQKLNWEWRVRELGKKLKIHLEEDKSAEKFDEKQWSDSLLSNNELIPYLVRVSEEFDLS